MKKLLITILSIALFSCKKEPRYGCVYESPKDNYVEKIKLVGKYQYPVYDAMRQSGKYGQLYFVPTDCDCKEYL